VLLAIAGNDTSKVRPCRFFRALYLARFADFSISSNIVNWCRWRSGTSLLVSACRFCPLETPQ